MAQMKTLNAVGATVLANACGPCIGQWKRDDLQKEQKTRLFTSFNRNSVGAKMTIQKLLRLSVLLKL